MVKLDAVRDLLLPAVYGFAGSHRIDGDIRIDHMCDCLVLRFCLMGRRSEGIIERSQIESERYKRVFRPFLHRVYEAIFDTDPDFRTVKMSEAIYEVD